MSDIASIRRYDDALFSARDVETGYGDLQVLYGVDIDVQDDEVVLVFGPNGAGKSTLMRALFRQLPLWAGTIRMGQQDFSDLDSNEMVPNGVAYVPQTQNVFPNLTVAENLDIGSIHADRPAERRQELFELFPRLADRQGQDAATLSGGERQMLAMARALMPDPDLLLIDEPSAGLAPKLIERAFEHVDSIRESGTAVLMVEQNVKAALEVTDRAYALDMGENKFEADADTIRDSEKVRDLYLGK
ncbi:ABC transporter ATP-binding protein [Halobacterium bonnevillei]|uniref:ATP-binding cassette domain-containing protein n=1 Tax=Halobacterium bonnevillei TaxID=2692200 RepID=A0A6B0SS03_9EURY|nr:ABC transporter ATP-binding protein [Halobacterium bonnevillei]MXR20369.1 ATP-binding cassette domain-containing protein [Halobacterium bonnevillei]